jgi:hypothetical protein
VSGAEDDPENPATGQRLVFSRTTEDSGGELLEVGSVYTKLSPSRPLAVTTPIRRSASRSSPARVTS